MNTTNANQTLGFDRFSECDYNEHWSYSNFNRNLMVANKISMLPYQAKVLELGAGSSDLENLVKKNFIRPDIMFTKIDADGQYRDDKKIKVMDITSSECNLYCSSYGPFDAVVFMEVIEHLEYLDVRPIINRIFDWLKPGGMLFVTTPTPPMNASYEDRVWPLDHKEEYTFSSLHGIINPGFKIQKAIGWSLEEREYNALLESKPDLAMVYTKLREAYPEGYIRALISSLAPVECNRQVLLVCKKRREMNGC